MLKEYFAPKLLRNPWTQCALAGIHLIHFREQKLCCRICSNHLVGCRFPHQASSVSWNLRSEWHLSTNLAMQIVNCAPWSPTLQCRHGCMSPSCGKGRMHSGGEHEWQIQRPHLRQWCFLKQSSRKRIWLTPSKVTNNLSDGHGVKMMIGHESKKVLSTPCSLRRKRQSFLPSFLPSQFAAPQKQPEVSLTYLTQLQLMRLQIGNEVPVKQHERKCYPWDSTTVNLTVFPQPLFFGIQRLFFDIRATVLPGCVCWFLACLIVAFKSKLGDMSDDSIDNLGHRTSPPSLLLFHQVVALKFPIAKIQT